VFGTPDSPTIAIREGNAVVVVGGLAALVLVGGCATLMALVLVHYERRRRELAVRLALGASARRLRADLLRELAVIAAVGTAGAVGASILGLNAIPSLSLPGGVDMGRLDLAIDWRVLAVGFGTTMVSLAAAAAFPVSRFARGRLAGELVAGPAATVSASSQRARQVLLALHVTATIVVLVAAGLFVRAVMHGFDGGAGFDPGRVAFVTIELGPGALSGGDLSPEEWLQASRDRAARLSEAIGALPGVEAVSTGVSPLSPQLARTVTEPVTAHIQGGEREVRLGRMWVGSEWLATLGVPILAGRSLTTVDAASGGAGAPSPAVVTASLARLFWPGENPVGQVLSAGGGRAGGTYEVVGVAGDFAFGSLVGPATGAVVTVNAMGYGNAPQFVVRTTSPGSLAQAVRKIVATLEPSARWMKVETGREIVARDLGRQRLGAWFFSGFGLTALLLGVGGVFGLVAYMADSRRREFGVRLALGATPRDLVRQAMAAALVPVSVGTAAGLVLAALASGVFTSLLTGLSPLDPLTYAAVAMVMLGCAAVAGVVAASRLRRLAPVDTLRAE
jgi:predicted permease